MPPRDPPFISETTVTRRSLLEWLGKATVLALGGEVLAACAESDGPRRADAAGATDARSDAAAPTDTRAGEDVRTDAGHSGPDAAPLEDAAAPDTAEDARAELAEPDTAATDAGAPGPDARFDVTPDSFTFAPGESDHAVFTGWGERTVDRQNLTTILASWRLLVDGMVRTPRTLTFADLVGLARTDEVMDFHCVEGWSIYDVPWSGVHMERLFELVGPLPSATHVTFHTIGERYNESLPLAVAREPHTILGYGIAGATLPLKHGFPLRVVVPRLLGYKSAKYVSRLELTDHPVEGFWVAAGYPYDGEVPAGRLREGRY